MRLGYLISESFDIARRALAANRMRSALALLGIVIGVGTVIGMVALINGFQRSFQENIQAFGNNTLYIRRIRPGIQFNDGVPDSLKARKAFTIGDAEAILDQAPAVAAVSVFKFAFNDFKISRGDRQTKTTFVYGTNDQLLRTHGYELARGRFFTQQEVARNANVIVLGKDTRETLFGDASGLGRTVHLNGVPLTVIGEFEAKGKFLGNNFDEVACIPYPLIDKYWGPPSDAPPWFPKRGELFLDAVAVSPEQNDAAITQIAEVLRVRRHLPSNKSNDFVVFSDDAFISMYNTITGGIFALMFLISSISLVVGGIGVMNIMLVAVTERTREIGVRKALGAPRRAILLQFLLEALLLTALGGALGISLGAGVSWLVHAVSPLPTFVSGWSVVVGLGVSSLIGVFFGLYPAMRASRLDPVESLRYE
ncbi:MAG: ABC transporter permease [Candidatus Eisenbacteria bacterium]|nr:ABC transporter permease [Candidatus Eisenbacteria bacterium]